jgi:hypothetical protein
MIRACACQLPYLDWQVVTMAQHPHPQAILRTALLAAAAAAAAAARKSQ